MIEETPEQIVSLLVPGTICKAPTSYGKVGYVQQLLDGWEVGDFVWHTRRGLMLTPRDAAHSLGLHWDHATGAFLGWYVNLQEPYRLTAPDLFNTEDWQPDSAWPLPALTDGWDRT